MHDNDVNDGKEGIRLPAVYAIVTLVEPENEKQEITAHDLIHEQGKESYCSQESSTVGVPRSRIILKGMDF